MCPHGFLCALQYMYEYLDASLTSQTAPEEVTFTEQPPLFIRASPSFLSLLVFLCQALRKFEEMSGKLTEQHRKLTKQVILLSSLTNGWMWVKNAQTCGGQQGTCGLRGSVREKMFIK